MCSPAASDEADSAESEVWRRTSTAQGAVSPRTSRARVAREADWSRSAAIAGGAWTAATAWTAAETSCSPAADRLARPGVARNCWKRCFYSSKRFGSAANFCRHASVSTASSASGLP